MKDLRVAFSKDRARKGGSAAIFVFSPGTNFYIRVRGGGRTLSVVPMFSHSTSLVVSYYRGGSKGVADGGIETAVAAAVVERCQLWGIGGACHSRHLRRGARRQAIAPDDDDMHVEALE